MMQMKNIKLLPFIACVWLMASCSDNFLERENPNEMTTSDFWKTEDDLMSGLNAAYRPLRFNGLYSRWLHVLYVSRSDEGYSTSPNPDFISYSNFLTRNNSDTEGVFFPWLDMYKGVFWANQVLDNAPKVTMDADLRERALGEAYFLRGVQYFHIAGVFGRGPLSLTSFAETDVPIGEQEDLYLQAKSDFAEAAKRLPAYYDNSKDLGRATQGAALGMLAKVCAQLHQWSEVEQSCAVIFALTGSSGQPLYKLVNYKDNFTAANENNEESLFEIQYASGIQAGIELGCQRPKFLGLPGDGIAFDDATARNIVKADLEKETTTSGQVDPRLKHTLFYYDVSTASEPYYGKTWAEWGTPNNSKVYWKKYTNYETQTYEDFNSGINFRVLRLADLYLLYAEALNELSRTAEAYTYINYVRRRADLPNLENSTVFAGIGNDQVKMWKQIMHERSCELAGESWRWLDLERWGMFERAEDISWLKSRDSEFNNFTIGKSNRFPIPYREIGLVKGLVQNPGF
ncbi:membrane protein [Bacteroidia bacterium]|nr:membrane protein [Bacteroidia bacterium]